MNQIQGLKKSLIIFWLLIAMFFVILAQFFVPVVMEFFAGSLFFLLPFLVLFLLGIALIFSCRNQQIEPRLKKSFILTGACASGFFISVILHNGFYALGVITSHISVLHYLMEALHVIFFLIAIPVCPLGFLAGAISSIVLLIKQKK